jgi:hypothetical protein
VSIVLPGLMGGHPDSLRRIGSAPRRESKEHTFPSQGKAAGSRAGTPSSVPKWGEAGTLPAVLVHVSLPSHWGASFSFTTDPHFPCWRNMEELSTHLGHFSSHGDRWCALLNHKPISSRATADLLGYRSPRSLCLCVIAGGLQGGLPEQIQVEEEKVESPLLAARGSWRSTPTCRGNSAL